MLEAKIWQDTVLSDEQILEITQIAREEDDKGNAIYSGISGYSTGRRQIAQAQAEATWLVAFKAGRDARKMEGQDSEKAKIRVIFKDANDLKELETRIREYLE